MENHRHHTAIEMYDRERQRIREAGTYGLRHVGILNGIPAVPAADDQSGRLVQDGLTCSLADDGTERWRNLGFGSV